MSEQDATPKLPPDAPFAVYTVLGEPGSGRNSTIGDYQLIAELGRGGMGVVYRARHVKLNREVALKMLTGRYGDEELKRFLAEAETAAQLHQTNIVHIYAVGESEGAPFFAMEYVEGGTLAGRLRKGLPTPREAATLLLPVARALHFAHQHGVVHRDMKPANILIETDGTPKIADFGIAKRLESEQGLTVSGAIMGTPAYMAPEQAAGSSRDVLPTADLYSLGAILYEMLAGRPPFLPEESTTAITVRILTEETVSPSRYRNGIPRDLEVICMKCLNKDPRDRYTSAAGLAEDLRRYLEDEPILARPTPRIVKTAKWVRRHPWRFFSRAALVMLAIGGLIWLGRWELYERPHLEHSVAIDFRHGGAEPRCSLRPDQARRNGLCLRLTRNGRWGPITRVDIVNPKGRPALVRDLMSYDLLPTYIEGALGIGGATGGRETVALEFAYAHGQAVQFIGRDRNGRVTVRVRYERIESDSGSHAVRAWFMNAQGNIYTTPSGASYADIIRNKEGRDVRVEFFTGLGKRARNGEGVFGYRLGRNPYGWLELLENLDENGQTMPNTLGVAKVRFFYDKQGYPILLKFLGADDRSVSMSGIAAVSADYDDAGNLRRGRKLDSKNNLVDTPDGPDNTFGSFAVREYIRNDAGEITRLVIGISNPKLTPPIAHHIDIRYDDYGYPSDLTVFATDTIELASIHFRRDERGNVKEEKGVDRNMRVISWKRSHYDPSGNCILSEELDEHEKITRRVRRRFDADHLIHEQYEDGQGEPMRIGSGYTQIDRFYHDNGYLLEEISSGFSNPNTEAVELHGLYNQQGRLQQEFWKDAQRQLVKGVQGWAVRKITYHENTGTILTEAYEDASGQPARSTGGYSAARNEYDERGLLIARVTEGYVASRGYNTMREKFDSRGYSVERTYFDSAGNDAWCEDGYHRSATHSFTERGKPKEEIAEEYDPSRFTCFRRRTSQTWNGQQLLRVLVQFEDREGNPALGPDGSSNAEIENSPNGDSKHVLLTGFPEAIYGFAAIEADFTKEGKPRRITHKRADGTSVEVRVLITRIFAGIQEKNTELRLGDILVSRNGEPVRSMLGVTLGAPFPGGWIEVERDGKTIRIDGFKPGKLGVFLSDRCADKLVQLHDQTK